MKVLGDGAALLPEPQACSHSRFIAVLTDLVGASQATHHEEYVQ